MSITRREVAKAASVSTATVSYVVNNGPRPVSAETRARVLKAIEQLGYRPNTVARSLTTQRTHTVGFITPDLLNPVHASVAKSAEQALLTAGYSMILCNSDEMPERELAYIQILLSKQVDAIALTPTGQNLNPLLTIVKSSTPLVLLDRELEGLRADCVLYDNEMGTYQAISHLLDLGHRRIGLISLPTTSTPGLERVRGYQRAMLERGVEVNPALTREGGFKDSGEALAESLFGMNPRPTAIMVSSNRLLSGLIRMVKERRLRMPEDLAICAFDDTESCTVSTPPITAVSTSVEQFGGEAARLLTERLRGTWSGTPRTVRIPCHLNIRESTVGTRGSLGVNMRPPPSEATEER